MAYTDPFSPEQSIQQPTIGGIVASSLNPVNVLGGIYTSVPTVWSNTKGIWSPVSLNQKVWKQQLENVFTRDKFDPTDAKKVIGKQLTVNWKKTPEAIKNLFNLNPLGGHRVFKGNLDRIDKLERSIKSLGGKNIGWMDKEIEYREKLIKTKGNTIIDVDPAGKASIRNIDEKIKFQESRMKRVRDVVGGRVRELNARKAAKWAIRGAKIGSAVGAATFIWDVTSAIASPLLKSSVQLIGNAINTFENRFMPEMGGKLQMSYLSYGAATERQRAVSAMSKAYINGRSAFGSEGQMYHQ